LLRNRNSLLALYLNHLLNFFYLNIYLGDYASQDNLEKIKEAVENGADVNSKDYDYRTPLHVASYFGRRDIVEYLL